MAPVPGARLTLVVDRPIAVYSGMVPGFVAGQYSREDLEVDVRPLALRAGARCIVAAATGVDPDARRLLLAERPPITYDTVSFDVGSTVAGLEIPGVREHAIPTRPIGAFVRRVDEVLAAARGREGFRVVVVGAGAGGGEVAFALAARLGSGPGRRVDVLLLESGPRVLPGYAASAARRVDARGRRTRGHDPLRRRRRPRRGRRGAPRGRRAHRGRRHRVGGGRGGAAALRLIGHRDGRAQASRGSAPRSSAGAATTSSRWATARPGRTGPPSPRPGSTRSARARCSRAT